jgi:hypothetical protein
MRKNRKKITLTTPEVENVAIVRREMAITVLKKTCVMIINISNLAEI